MMKKLLLLEINEIPWRIIDKFKSDPKLPNIKRFFENSKNYTTVVDLSNEMSYEAELVKGISKEGRPVVIDSGELSPWVTWPTFHRGITSQEHGIKFLGQDITTFKGKPIWQEFLDFGLNIGICGSLQSWPPLDPSPGGFYIPDTFAHNEKCFPRYIEPFQKFNLSQVQKNGLVIRQKELFTSEVTPLIFSFSRLGVKFNTLLKVVNQLFGELIDKSKLACRPIFQCVLFWDIFKHLYNIKSPPALATFFTNHVASIMHRYWHHIFPDDFGVIYKDLESSHEETMFFALKVVDNILFDAMNFCNKNPEIVLVFATSMGQDAIHYDSYDGYSAELEDVTKLFEIFGIKQNDYTPFLAMVPQVSIEVKDVEIRKRIIDCLSKCFLNSGKLLFSSCEKGNSLSITIHNPSREDVALGTFIYKGDNKQFMNIGWEVSGITIHKLDVATAYHTREGIMAVYGKGIIPNNSRHEILLSKCKSYLMNLAFQDR